ncbi:MAG: short-chain dehydrogenase, partial [Anaerolineae bacterium]
LYLATDPAVADTTGAYFIARKPVSPAPQAQDPDLARRLWEISAQRAGLVGG